MVAYTINTEKFQKGKRCVELIQTNFDTQLHPFIKYIGMKL